MSKCSECGYGSFGRRDPASDFCDGCQNDPDTGWGGFTDHYIGKHFDSDEEREEWRKSNANLQED